MKQKEPARTLNQLLILITCHEHFAIQKQTSVQQVSYQTNTDHFVHFKLNFM